MDHSKALTEMDPMPIWSPAPSDHSAQRSRSPLPPHGNDGMPPEGMALHLGPNANIPDHPGSVVGFDRPISRPMSQPMPPQQTYAPMTPAPYLQQYEAPDIRTLRQSCQYNLREYLVLQRNRERFDARTSAVDLEYQLRSQTGMVLSDLANLQLEVRNLAKAAQNHRWRKWLVGGILQVYTIQSSKGDG